MKEYIKRNWTLLAAIVFCLAVCLAIGQGCATTGVGKAYDMLYTATVSYETIMKFAAEQYVQGNINDEQKAKIIDYANKYYTAIIAGQKALKVYKMAELRGENLNNEYNALMLAIDVMHESEGLFMDYVREAAK